MERADAQQKFDVLLWLMVSELLERKLDEIPRQISAARALPEKQRIKDLLEKLGR